MKRPLASIRQVGGSSGYSGAARQPFLRSHWRTATQHTSDTEVRSLPRGHPVYSLTVIVAQQRARRRAGFGGPILLAARPFPERVQDDDVVENNGSSDMTQGCAAVAVAASLAAAAAAEPLEHLSTTEPHMTSDNGDVHISAAPCREIECGVSVGKGALHTGAAKRRFKTTYRLATLLDAGSMRCASTL